MTSDLVYELHLANEQIRRLEHQLDALDTRLGLEMIERDQLAARVEQLVDREVQIVAEHGS